MANPTTPTKPKERPEHAYGECCGAHTLCGSIVGLVEVTRNDDDVTCRKCRKIINGD
jgi:hypothetical protein